MGYGRTMSKRKMTIIARLSEPSEGFAWLLVNGNETIFANVSRLKAEYREAGYKVTVRDISAKAG